MNFLFFIKAHAFPAMCLIGICFAKCDENLTIGLLTLAVNFQGALYTGYFVNPLDIASNYAGMLISLKYLNMYYMFKYFNY